MFTFHSPRTTIVGLGAAGRLVEHVRPILGDRILLVTDKNIRRMGLLSGILGQLAQSGIAVAVFDDIPAEPPEPCVFAGVHIARTHRATGVLGIGGGSPMDVAKLIALIGKSGESLAEAYGVSVAKGPRLPLVLVPTTAGTGSEATPVSVLTTADNEKKAVVSSLLLPDMAILDAELILGLPRTVTAATGIDAIVHAIEAYTSVSQNNNPISKAMAREALRLLGGNLREAFSNGANAAARAQVLLGAHLAGKAFANSPVAAIHALAYPLGGRFGIPHGLANALIMPHVMRFNLPIAARAYGEIAADLFPELGTIPEAGRGQALVEALVALCAALELPARLSAAGVSEAALPLLARDAMKQTRLLINNPRPVAEQEAYEIYKAAY
ncbi:MAG: iron-containing alcohol dehydrogenase [Proteobacteria bacterium]|nr:iron-containing alcohol dehydrogenase [Pseudomonadota bacterium]